jgi:Smg protein
MKDSLFEMLLGLFEKTLAEIKESSSSNSDANGKDDADIHSDTDDNQDEVIRAEIVKSAKDDSIRIFTHHEQMKFTKASYQFLMRMIACEIIHPEVLELIINQMVFSDSRIVTLEETKWNIRNVLSEMLNDEQLAFLDLVLYQKEDKYTVH